jgi:hypothetical protein
MAEARYFLFVQAVGGKPLPSTSNSFQYKEVLNEFLERLNGSLPVFQACRANVTVRWEIRLRDQNL